MIVVKILNSYSQIQAQYQPVKWAPLQKGMTTLAHTSITRDISSPHPASLAQCPPKYVFKLEELLTFDFQCMSESFFQDLLLFVNNFCLKTCICTTIVSL
jgi:hypothetical protein